MIVLDTDIISILDSASGTAFDHVRHHLRLTGNATLAVTIVSFEEQMRGWLSYIAASRQLAREVQGYARLGDLVTRYGSRVILPFDTAAATRFQALRASRLRVGSMDLKIAAIAIARDLPLVTANVGDFIKIPGLKLLDWSK